MKSERSSGGGLSETSLRTLTDVFAGGGYTRIEPPVLQPAAVFLDLLGDAVRTGTFVFTDPGGTETCLRPDFTIAACREYLAAGTRAKVARLWYAGPIYRYAPSGSGEPSEVCHAGIELLGESDKKAADVEVLRLCLDALRAAGESKVNLQFGDLALFSALVDALDLPAQWRGRLRRHFVRPDDFARLLARLSDGAPARKGPQALIAALGKLSEDEARAVIADILELADIQAVGSRSIEEITERFLEQAAEASALSLGPATVRLIEDFLAIEGRPDTALSKLRAFAKSSRVALGPAIETIAMRFDLMAKAGIALAGARFSTSFGRRLGYYTGFIFGVERAGARALPLASGGRYDGLLRALGGARDTPAVGATVFCDNLGVGSRAS